MITECNQSSSLIMLQYFIFPKDPGQSEPGSNGIEEVPHKPESSRTESSLSDAV